MTIYTIGFAQKNAKQFFSCIKNEEIQVLVDVRLNNKSQLAGFTKAPDLLYFLKELCRCDYMEFPSAAPTKELLDNYKKKIITWEEYTKEYISLIQKRNSAELFLQKMNHFERICLLCSEPTPEQCHRRLFAEQLQSAKKDIRIVHLGVKK